MIDPPSLTRPRDCWYLSIVQHGKREIGFLSDPVQVTWQAIFCQMWKSDMESLLNRTEVCAEHWVHHWQRRSPCHVESTFPGKSSSVFFLVGNFPWGERSGKCWMKWQMTATMNVFWTCQLGCRLKTVDVSEYGWRRIDDEHGPNWKIAIDTAADGKTLIGDYRRRACK